MPFLPKMYREFAPWFHLLTAPAEYEEEAAEYHRHIGNAGINGAHVTILELGSGGGNNASHLKQHYRMTLSDLSPEMLALSQTLNPECEHIEGDMRTLRLGRTFDVVFTHDAVMYMTTEEELRLAIETAFAHCRPGGIAVFAPDAVKETLVLWTSHGGHDGDGRSMRYLEWTVDPDPDDTWFLADFVYVLREEGKPVQVAQDQHVLGVFSLVTWERLFADAGFEVQVRPDIRRAPHPDESEIFVVRRKSP